MHLAQLNRIIDRSWPRIAREIRRRAQEVLTAPRKVASGTLLGKHYELTVRFKPKNNGIVFSGMEHGPGFLDTPNFNKLAFALPTTGTWRVRLDGRVAVKGRIDGLGSITPVDEPLTVDLELGLKASTRLDDVGVGGQPDPARVPRMRPLSLDELVLKLKATGLVTLDVDLTGTDRVEADGTVVFEVEPGPLEIGEGRRFDGTLTLRIGTRSRLSVHGKVHTTLGDFPVDLDSDLPLASVFGPPQKFGWGLGRTATVATVPAGFDPLEIAGRVEEGLIHHSALAEAGIDDALLVMDSRYPAGDETSAVCQPAGVRARSFHGLGDTAIWTGHLLAAEAFRFASAGSDAERADAREQADRALRGIEILLDVPAHFLGRRGLLCRSALPHPLAARAEESLAHGPTGPGAGSNYFGVRLDDFPGQVWDAKGRDSDAPSRDAHLGVFFGLFVAMKLMTDPASALLRERAAEALLAILDYVVDNDWSVPTPAGPIVAGQPLRFSELTTFCPYFIQQLALLRIGAEAEAAFPRPAARYQALYVQYAADGAEKAWVPLMLDCQDPLESYFKFNLVQAVVALLRWTEPAGSAQRPFYDNAMGMLRSTLRHHRNAYFDLLYLLGTPAGASRDAARAEASGGSVHADGSAVSVDDEVRHLLHEWSLRLPAPGQTRPVGPNCLPVALTAAGTVAHYEGLDTGGGLAVKPGTKTELVALGPLPCQHRPGFEMDFLWQRDPFKTVGTRHLDGSVSWQRSDDAAGDTWLETPAVDYLLAVYLARYLGVV